MPPGQQSQFFGQKVSKPGINVNHASDNQLVYKNDFSSTLYYNSSGVPTVLLGLRKANGSNGLSSDEQGLFVSQSGIDVSSADDSQLIFNSSQDIFKIALTGTTTFASVSVGAGATVGQTNTIAHNLGIIPAYQTYILGGNFPGVLSFPTTAYVALGASQTNYDGVPNISSIYYTAVDATNLYIGRSQTNSSGGALSSGTSTLRYYILQETAN